jgi:hypothetical protein
LAVAASALAQTAGYFNRHVSKQIGRRHGEWWSHSDASTNFGGTLITVLPANYGSTNRVTNFGYDLFRSANGANLASFIKAAVGTPGIGGRVIDLPDLNVPPGTIVYGYAIFPNNTTYGGSMANPADWSNATYSPTSGASGVHLAADNVLQFGNNVP